MDLEKTEKLDRIQALEIIRNHNRVSTSFLQRMMLIGYNRAAIIVDDLEQRGLIGPIVLMGKREIHMDKVVDFLENRK